MVGGRWWIVPAGLCEVARAAAACGVCPQGGGVCNIDDGAVFAAIVYVLVPGCAWRVLPPCFGASTVHRRFVLWAVFIAQCWSAAGLVDLSRMLPDTAHRRAKTECPSWSASQMATPSTPTRRSRWTRAALAPQVAQPATTLAGHALVDRRRAGSIGSGRSGVRPDPLPCFSVCPVGWSAGWCGPRWCW
ncbi:transposase [Amycolatopsis ultiminotia]|uniref:transposase n=1 Tax=Amycolatopsis ultiminotia TaxID=543629 RepID=UPI003CD06E4F